MSGETNHDLARRMAELARTVATPRKVDDVLSDVTAEAMNLIPGVAAAGVLLVGRDGGFQSLAGTSELPHKLDELQMKHREGPCLDAATHELVVRADDFRTEVRWPMYSPEAVELGVLSSLSFKLYTSSRTAGALNLFATEANAFDSEDEAIGTVLAAHAAAAIMASRNTEQLESALITRDRIGQAKGIIMERYKVTDVAAFDMLRKLSQDSNVRLAEVAQRVIETADG
ncbi:GAF and ANTAR domain-containing protein [Mycobacterium sp. SMC-4]|uniref:GAF and ANTAR domain-containing protein n=1 Tax=Mycobacterium sp. SMC-4 TaxID=2857059 RepID=UPI003CFC3306